MAEVTITVNDNDYVVACADGEEAHLQEVAAIVNTEIKGLIETVGKAGEARLLLMASLLLADRLQDLGDGAETGDDGLVFLTRPETTEQESEAASAMHSAAQRIENLAASIKKS